MKFAPSLIFLSLIPFFTYSQTVWSDRFDDGSLKVGKVWTGDSLSFNESQGFMNLNDTSYQGRSAIWTGSQSSWKGSWSFYFHFDFNPSSANYANIYLSIPDKLAKDGYFIEIGGSSSDQLSLVRRVSGSDSYLIRSQTGLLNSVPIQGVVEVTRDTTGEWLLKYAPDSISNPAILGTALLPDTPISKYFLVECIYTKTRADKFSFDNISVAGRKWVDRTPPRVRSIQNSPDSIVITFSENMDTIKGMVKFSIPGLLSWKGKKEITLNLIRATQPGKLIHLDLLGLEDQAGNTLDTTIWFIPDHPRTRDLVISEIMFDPTPPAYSPPTEYIEVFNRTSHGISLKRGSLYISGTEVKLDSIHIPPRGFTVLSDRGTTSLFPSGTPVIECDLPPLPNSGALIKLIDQYAGEVDRVFYDPTWIRDKTKVSGGWSIEKKEMNGSCSEGRFWAENTWKGGTPGKPNSPPPGDLNSPTFTLTSIQSPSDSILEWHFSHELDMGNPIPNLTTPEPDSVWIEPTRRRSIIYLFRNGFPPVVQTQPIRILSCLGNSLFPPVITLTPPVDPITGDIIVTEILFDPPGKCQDMVELINQSQKTFLLNRILMGQMKEEEMDVGGPITDHPILFLPGSRIFLTGDTMALCPRYGCGPPLNWVRTDLPSLPDDQGNLFLLLPDHKPILLLSYSSDQHSPYYKDLEGISLENPTQSMPPQWSSTPLSMGGATPGREGSTRHRNDTDRWFHLVNDQIRSDPDKGYDPLQLDLNVPPGSHFMSRLFYENGAPAGNPFPDQVVTGKISLIWNGKLTNGKVPPAGIYILWCQLAEPNGTIREEKVAILLLD